MPQFQRLIPFKTVISAKDQNARADAIEWLSRIQGQAPIEVLKNGSGPLIRLRQRPSFWAVITASTSNPHSWQKVIHTGNGTYVLGDLTGSSASYPAIEANNHSVAVGTIVRLEPSEHSAFEMLFTYS